jgi:peptidoglycan/LPS O-acetylase OafA/YrhL
MWHLPLLFVFINVIGQQPQGTRHSLQLIALLGWVFFVIFPISLMLYRWIEMPGMRLGEMLIQKIDKLKKGPPVDMLTDTSTDKITTHSLVEVPR